MWNKDRKHLVGGNAIAGSTPVPDSTRSVHQVGQVLNPVNPVNKRGFYRIQGHFLNVFRGKTTRCSRIVWRSLSELKTLCGALSKVVVANLLILYPYCFCSKFKSVSNYIDRKNFNWLPILAYKNMLLTSASGNVPTTLNRSQIPEGL